MLCGAFWEREACSPFKVCGSSVNVIDLITICNSPMCLIEWRKLLFVSLLKRVSLIQYGTTLFLHLIEWSTRPLNAVHSRWPISMSPSTWPLNSSAKSFWPRLLSRATKTFLRLEDEGSFDEYFTFLWWERWLKHDLLNIRRKRQSKINDKKREGKRKFFTEHDEHFSSELCLSQLGESKINWLYLFRDCRIYSKLVNWYHWLIASLSIGSCLNRQRVYYLFR